MLRLITDGRLAPDEAVRAYHGVLQGKGIRPKLSLEKDLEPTDQTMSYSGSGGSRSMVQVRNNPLAATGSTEKSEISWPSLPNGAPDFAAMTPAQRGAYDAGRLKRRFE
jgi:hypothetical protein